MSRRGLETHKSGQPEHQTNTNSRRRQKANKEKRWTFMMLKNESLARTIGAVLRITVRIPRNGLPNFTHISAMFAGMGGKDDIMGNRCGDWPREHREELPNFPT